MKILCEYTDTFNGEANYSWVRRATITVPDLLHYGFDGSLGYVKANKKQRREIMRQGKKALGLTGVRGIVSEYHDTIEFRPYRSNTIAFFIQED